MLRSVLLLFFAGCGRIDFAEEPRRAGSFGDLEIGPSHGQTNTDVARASAFELLEAATPTSIVVAMDSLGTAAAGHVRGLVYDADAAGMPRALVASSEATLPPGQAAGWVHLAIGSSARLAAGTYWLGVQADTMPLQYYYTADPSALAYGMDDYADGPEAMFRLIGRDDRRLSIYVDYQAR